MPQFFFFFFFKSVLIGKHPKERKKPRHTVHTSVESIISMVMMFLG